VTGLLYLFSKKERAKRKNQQAERAAEVQVPPAYSRRNNYHDHPRSAHPRPLSSFAPDYRQSQYLPRASMDQPSLPTYDPSKYQPIRPISTSSADPHTSYNMPSRVQPSRLSNVHYNDGRSSITIQRTADQSGYSTLNARRQSGMPFQAHVSESRSRPGEGRERSASEPMPLQGGTRGPRRAKPVLSRLVTNFG
jgi:hypothetical protein